MKKYILFACLIVALFTACSKYNTDPKELPTWTSDWLLPLIKGKLAFENIKEISEVKTSFNVPSLDIGYPSGVNVNVPPLNISAVGPYKQSLSNWIHVVNFDSLEIMLSFQNVFPIAIGAGTKFSFRRSTNTNDPNNIIYQHTIPNDIAPNQNYSFDINVINNFLTDTVYIFLEQFTSPGGNNITFSATPSKINVEIKVIDINRVELYPNKSLTEIDTVDIDFSKEDTGTDTANYGKINFFVDNALPINFYIQVYFLDPINSQIVDSLLDNPFNAIGCNTNANGDPTNVNASKTSVNITTARIEKIKKSKRAVLSYKLNTLGYPPPYVVMSDKTYLKMQITGDLHLSFNLNSL